MTRLLLVVGSDRVAADSSPLILLIMDAQDKLLFDDWLRRNYPQLHQELSDTDSLHDAYVIVINRNRNAKRNEYRPLMNKAYRAARNFYKAYAMRFLLPDQLFWVYAAMQHPNYEETEEQKSAKDKRDYRKLDALKHFVNKYYTPTEYRIFSDFRFRKKTYKELAKDYGLSVQTISALIQNICESYKKNKYNEKNTNQASVRT